MNDTVDLDAGDGSALKRRKKNAAKRVTKRRAEAALEWLDHQFGVAARVAACLDLRAVRADQFFPVTVVHTGRSIGHSWPPWSCYRTVARA